MKDIEQEIKLLDTILEDDYPIKKDKKCLNLRISILVDKNDLESLMRNGDSDWQRIPHPMSLSDLMFYLQHEIEQLRGGRFHQLPWWAEKITFAEIEMNKNA